MSAYTSFISDIHKRKIKHDLNVIYIPFTFESCSYLRSSSMRMVTIPVEF